MPEWRWFRIKGGKTEIAVTSSLNPPKGKGWALVKGQSPGGIVKW